MYNRFRKYFLGSGGIGPRQFYLRDGHSTGLAIIQLDDWIFEAFESSLYTPDVFIGLLSSLSSGGSHGVACSGSRGIWGWPGLRVE